MTPALDRIAQEMSKCDSLADIGCSSPETVIALHRRFDCGIQLVWLTPEGQFDAPGSERKAAYLERLREAGIPSEQIRSVHDVKAVRPADLVLSLDGFGDSWKVKHLAMVLDSALHADSLLAIDIRKGSGAFPFLRDGYGDTEIIEDLDGERLRRVIMRPRPPVPQADDSWAQIASELAGQDGFFAEGPSGHSFLHVPRSPDVLVVTFDNLDIAMNKRADRRPWGYDFIEKQGWSMLGVLAGGWTWYREPWVAQTFDRLRDEGFFDRYKRVVFYGASMGGYAAAAFSAACPGADVVVMSPQSTLDKSMVPFETRYHAAWGFDYSGPYGDAAQSSRTARAVTILFDPYEPLDSGHVARFTGDNVILLRCPMMGHRLGSSLSQMGLLSKTILSALSGTIEPATFYRDLRVRHHFPRYQKELFNRAIQMKRPGLARRVGKWVLARGDNRAIRLGMASLEDQAAGRA